MGLLGYFKNGCGCTPQKEELNHGLKVFNHGLRYVAFSSEYDDDNEEAVKYDYTTLLQTEFSQLAEFFGPIWGYDIDACQRKLIAKFNKEMIKVAIYNPYCWRDVKYTAQALVRAVSVITEEHYYGVVKFEQVELTDVYGVGTTKTVSIPSAVANINNTTPDVLVPNNKTMMKDLFVAVAQAMFPDVFIPEP